MRVVVDTNVLISAALKDRSVPAAAVRLAGQHVLLKSMATERQLIQVVARPYLARLISPASKAWLADLMARAEPIEIVGQIAVCRDPTDDKFLELAVSGRADVIVSGDNDLLVLDPFRGIPVLTPAGFARIASG